MAIYDNDGTTLHEISKVYDHNGTNLSQIGKVYDNNITTNSLIYEANTPYYENGYFGVEWEVKSQRTNSYITENGDNVSLTTDSSDWHRYVNYGTKEFVDLTNINKIIFEVTTPASPAVVMVMVTRKNESFTYADFSNNAQVKETVKAGSTRTTVELDTSDITGSNQYIVIQLASGAQSKVCTANMYSCVGEE